MKFILSILLSFCLFSFCLTPTKYFIRLYKSQSNSAYVGIENPIHFETTEKNKYPLIFIANSGKVTFTETDTSLTITSLTTNISVYKVVSEDTVLVYKQKITPKLLPYPSVAINDIKLNGSVDRQVFLDGISLDGFFTNDIIGSNNFFQVKSFVVILNGKSIDNNGKDFSTELKELFKTIKIGDKLTFDKILISGPSGITRYLGDPINVTIK